MVGVGVIVGVGVNVAVFVAVEVFVGVKVEVEVGVLVGVGVGVVNRARGPLQVASKAVHIASSRSINLDACRTSNIFK
jgi:hypothetical protein